MPPKDSPANNHLLALGTAAVLAVFGAGFVRTEQAAARLESTSRRRPPTAPVAAPANKSEANAPAPAEPLTPEHVPPETTRTAQATPITQKTKTKVDIEVPEKPKTEQHMDTSTTAAIAAAPVIIRPTPAPADTTPPKPPVESATSVARDLKDGVYTGWGTSRHGDIESRVEIKNGRIISASIAQCLTMYSVYWIAALPPQVVRRQSPEVDIISGATESSNAFYDGIVAALKKAQSPTRTSARSRRWRRSSPSRWSGTMPIGPSAPSVRRASRGRWSGSRTSPRSARASIQRVSFFA